MRQGLEIFHVDFESKRMRKANSIKDKLRESFKRGEEGFHMGVGRRKADGGKQLLVLRAFTAHI